MVQEIAAGHWIGDIVEVLLEQLKVQCAHTPGDPSALDGDMTIEAIPSWYGGTTFRSKLEAHWAATLDTIGVAWTYEPEAITLPSGATYIPDFWLPDIGTWLEVKGPGVPRVEKAVELAGARACRCEGRCSCEWPGGELVLIGHKPAPLAIRDPDRYLADYWERRRHDNAIKRFPGQLSWSAADGRRVWFSRCIHCGRGEWTPPRHHFCRACGRQFDNTPVYDSGAAELKLVNSDALPCPTKAAA